MMLAWKRKEKKTLAYNSIGLVDSQHFQKQTITLNSIKCKQGFKSSRKNCNPQIKHSRLTGPGYLPSKTAR